MDTREITVSRYIAAILGCSDESNGYSLLLCIIRQAVIG